MDCQAPGFWGALDSETWLLTAVIWGLKHRGFRPHPRRLGFGGLGQASTTLSRLLHVHLP